MEEKNNSLSSIIVKDLISSEHYKDKGHLVPLLDGLSFEIYKGDKVGISAFSKEELVAVIEILGNMRSYYKGYVKLSSLGTKAKKKSLVEQLFYLDSPKMLYEDMSLLEQLMYAKNTIDEANNIVADAGYVQKDMLDYICSCHMEKYVLTPIKKMKDSVKMVVGMMVALLTNSEKLIINASNYFFTYEEACSIKALFNLYKDKTVVLGTFDNKLIGMSCLKAIYISKGKVQSYTTVSELYKNWDKVTCSIKSSDNKALVAIVDDMYKKPYPFYEEEGYIFFETIKPEDFIGPLLFKKCLGAKITLDKIRINQGRVANAFNEIEANKK